MEWLTEHFEIILPVALVLLFLFQRMFVHDKGEEGVRPEDSETQQEARRIQEEIRRKIIARQRGLTEEQEAPPPVAYEETPGQRPATFPRREEQPAYQGEAAPPAPPRPPPPRPRPVVRRPEPVVRSRDLQDELRVQMERLRESRVAKEDALRRTPASARGQRARATRAITPSARGDLRTRLLADLSTSDNMKRAFVLKEVVDRPIGLRDRPDIFSNWS